jgi:ketosteroid isomerase-like protein
MMAEHPNVERLRSGYTAFSKGDFAALDQLIDKDATWHVTGRNQLSGDYRGRDEVYRFFGQIVELTGGTFALDVHTILADDDHGVVLVTASASREGRSIKTQDVHVYHLRSGRITESWNASTDQYAGDELLG